MAFFQKLLLAFMLAAEVAPLVVQKCAAFLPLLRIEEGTSLRPRTSRARSPSQRRTAPLAACQLLCSTPRAPVPKASPRARARPAQGTCPWRSPCSLSAGAGLAQALQQMPPMGLLLVPGQLLGAPGAGSLRLHPTPNLSPFRGRGKQGSGSGQGLGKAPLTPPETVGDSPHSLLEPGRAPRVQTAPHLLPQWGQPPGASIYWGCWRCPAAVWPRAVQVHPWTPSCPALSSS